jgi:hypothetical protein
MAVERSHRDYLVESDVMYVAEVIEKARVAVVVVVAEPSRVHR